MFMFIIFICFCCSLRNSCARRGIKNHKLVFSTLYIYTFTTTFELWKKREHSRPEKNDKKRRKKTFTRLEKIISFVREIVKPFGIWGENWGSPTSPSVPKCRDVRVISVWHSIMPQRCICVPWLHWVLRPVFANRVLFRHFVWYSLSIAKSQWLATNHPVYICLCAHIYVVHI